MEQEDLIRDCCRRYEEEKECKECKERRRKWIETERDEQRDKGSCFFFSSDFSFSALAFEVSDVTRRYTRKWEEVLARRTELSEQRLAGEDEEEERMKGGGGEGKRRSKEKMKQEGKQAEGEETRRRRRKRQQESRFLKKNIQKIPTATSSSFFLHFFPNVAVLLERLHQINTNLSNSAPTPMRVTVAARAKQVLKKKYKKKEHGIALFGNRFHKNNLFLFF